MTRTYGILDLAAAPELRLELADKRRPVAEPLFDRDAFPDLLMVGPWLVDLAMNPKVIELWKTRGRWRNWGYVVLSGHGLVELRLHLRKFNLATIPGQASPVLFRYFDPRVAYLFLSQVANQAQYDAFMAAMERVDIEDSANERILCFERRCTDADAPDEQVEDPQRGTAPRPGEPPRTELQPDFGG